MRAEKKSNICRGKNDRGEDQKKHKGDQSIRKEMISRKEMIRRKEQRRRKEQSRKKGRSREKI